MTEAMRADPAAMDADAAKLANRTLGEIAADEAGVTPDEIIAAADEIISDVERASSSMDTASDQEDDAAEEPPRAGERSAKTRLDEARIYNKLDVMDVDGTRAPEIIAAVADEFQVSEEDVARIVDAKEAEVAESTGDDEDEDLIGYDESDEADGEPDEGTQRIGGEPDGEPVGEPDVITIGESEPEGADYDPESLSDARDGDAGGAKPTAKREAEDDAAPAAKKPRKTRTTHPRLAEIMMGSATPDGADATALMEDTVKWLMSSKQFKGTKCALLTDGVVLEANGRYYIIETPNGAVNKCVKVEHGAGAITIDDSDSEGEPEAEPEAAPAAAASSLRQMAFGSGSVAATGPARVDATWCTGGRQFQTAAKQFSGLFISDCSVATVDGQPVLHRVKTTAFKTESATAGAFRGAIGGVCTRLKRVMGDGHAVTFHIGPNAHTELQGLAHELQAELVRHGETVIAKEHDDFVRRITDPDLVSALIDDPTMVPATLSTIVAYMGVGEEFARILPGTTATEPIEWEENPEEAFAPEKIAAAFAIKRPTTSNSGALATWNAISDRAREAQTLAECFPPGAVPASMEVICQTAMKLYGIIQAGSFRETMLTCQQQLLALKDGAAQPTNEAVVNTVKEDEAAGVDLVAHCEEWLNDHGDEARDRAAKALRAVTHTKAGSTIAIKQLERLATSDRTESLQKRAADPERDLVLELAKLAIGPACDAGKDTGEMGEDVLETTAGMVLDEVYADEPTGIGAAIRLIITGYYTSTYEAKQAEVAERTKARDTSSSGRKRKPNGWHAHDDAAPAPKRLSTKRN